MDSVTVAPANVRLPFKRLTTDDLARHERLPVLGAGLVVPRWLERDAPARQSCR
jgi:hypothetical protein